MKFTNNLTKILIFIMLLLALTRIAYYSYDLLHDDFKLLFMDNRSLREEFYGSYYTFYINVKDLDTGTSYYLVTSDGKAFFLMRYWLYPKNVILVTNLAQLEKLVSDGSKVFIVFGKAEKFLVNTLISSGYKKVDILKGSLRIGGIYTK